MLRNLFFVAVIVAIVVLAIDLGTSLQERMISVDQQSAQVRVIESQADLNSAQARKTNAEAHRIEDELLRDKYGWTAVTMSESGIGNLVLCVAILGAFGLFGIIGIVMLRVKPYGLK